MKKLVLVLSLFMLVACSGDQEEIQESIEMEEDVSVMNEASLTLPESSLDQSADLNEARMDDLGSVGEVRGEGESEFSKDSPLTEEELLKAQQELVESLKEGAEEELSRQESANQQLDALMEALLKEE